MNIYMLCLIHIFWNRVGITIGASIAGQKEKKAKEEGKLF